MNLSLYPVGENALVVKFSSLIILHNSRHRWIHCGKMQFFAIKWVWEIFRPPGWPLFFPCIFSQTSIFWTALRMNVVTITELDYALITQYTLFYKKRDYKKQRAILPKSIILISSLFAKGNFGWNKENKYTMMCDDESAKWMQIWAKLVLFKHFLVFGSTYFFLVFENAYYFHPGGWLLAKIFTLEIPWRNWTFRIQNWFIM